MIQSREIWLLAIEEFTWALEIDPASYERFVSGVLRLLMEVEHDERTARQLARRTLGRRRFTNVSKTRC